MELKNILFVFMFLLVSNIAISQTNYYISQSGSDAANGLTTATAWKTIAKVNASTFSPGDSVLFKRGDSWNEQLRITNSGNSGSPIVISSYGIGDKPIITGFQSTTLVDQGSNIWKATISSSVASENTVMIGGLLRAKGRYPNSSYLTSNNAATTQYKFIATGLGGSYAGAELVTKGYNWIIDVNKILTQSGDTLNLATSLSYNLTNYSYFIQNALSVLDVQNEWYFDSTNKALYVYSVGNPGTVYYSTIDTLIRTYQNNYISFSGLNIDGANCVGINSDTSRGITITNCIIQHTGGWNPKPATMLGLSGSAIRGEQSKQMSITYDSLLNNQSDAIFIIHGSDSALIDNNYIDKSGQLIGMGTSSNGSYTGLFSQGNGLVITNNKVKNTGYCPIFWAGLNAQINHNYIDSFCTVKDDAGGIYTNGSSGFETGSVVKLNIVKNGIGVEFIAAGLYFDGSSTGVLADSNTVQDCAIGGILFSAPNHITVTNNTVVNSKGAGIYYALGGGNNQTIKHNIIYSTDSMQYVYNNYYRNISGMILDSNYYLRPLKTSQMFYIGEHLWKFNLSQFQDTTGYDTHSSGSLAGVTSAAGVLYTNPTLSDSTISLSGLYYDAKMTPYNNSILLHSFQSALLFKSASEVPVIRSTIKIGNILL